MAGSPRWVVAALFIAAWVALPAVAQAPPMSEVKRLVEQAAGLMKQGKADEAAPVVEAAMQAAEQQGAEHPAVASMLMMRMGIQLGRLEFANAEASGKRALVIFDRSFGPDFPLNGMAAMQLALVYTMWGRPMLAEPWDQRYLAAMEKQDRDGRMEALALQGLVR